MYSRNADIIQAQNIVAQNFSRYGRFLRDRNIARAAGGNNYAPLAVRLWYLADNADACHAVILKRKLCLYIFRRFLGKAGYEHGLLLVFQHSPGDAEDMLLGLALAEYDLGHALTYAAVEVYLGLVAELLKRLHFQFKRRIVGTDAPVGNMI